MRFTSDKLVYIDFNEIIFANLYIGRDNSSTYQFRVNIKTSDDTENPASQLERPRAHCLREDPKALLQGDA